MTDIVLNEITSNTNLSNINTNFSKIQESVNEDLLNLDGGNNVMLQEIDMNSHKIINVADGTSYHEAVNFGQLMRAVTGSDQSLFVLSFNGRSGEVVPEDGDYTFSQISDTPNTLAGYGIVDAATSAQGSLAESALQPGDSIPVDVITGLTAESVNLDQVDNTSDLDKPVSTAQQTALNGKLSNGASTRLTDWNNFPSPALASVSSTSGSTNGPGSGTASYVGLQLPYYSGNPGGNIATLVSSTTPELWFRGIANGNPSPWAKAISADSSGNVTLTGSLTVGSINLTDVVSDVKIHMQDFSNGNYLGLTVSGDDEATAGNVGFYEYGSTGRGYLFAVNKDTLTAKVYGGLSMGSSVASSATDISKHLMLYGTTYGLNVTPSRLGYIAPTTGRHEFSCGSTVVGSFDSSGLTVPKIRFTNTADASNTSTDHALQIGLDSGNNIRIDSNEILAVNNGTTNYLTVQNEGGATNFGGDVNVSGTLTTYSQDIVSGSSKFIGSIFGRPSSGTMYIRPVGKDSTTAQTTIANNGNMTVSGTVTANGSVLTSDRTLKKNIDNFYARHKISDKLALYSFDWKDESQGSGISVIAQDVQRYAPEYVHEYEHQEGMKLGVDKVSLLLECVVELSERVRDLESKLNAN